MTLNRTAIRSLQNPYLVIVMDSGERSPRSLSATRSSAMPRYVVKYLSEGFHYSTAAGTVKTCAPNPWATGSKGRNNQTVLLRSLDWSFKINSAISNYCVLLKKKKMVNLREWLIPFRWLNLWVKPRKKALKSVKKGPAVVWTPFPLRNI